MPINAHNDERIQMWFSMLTNVCIYSLCAHVVNGGVCLVEVVCVAHSLNHSAICFSFFLKLQSNKWASAEAYLEVDSR